MDSSSMKNGTLSRNEDEVSVLSLATAIICPLAVVLLSCHLNLKIGNKLFVGLVRCVCQLLLLGYVILGFIFSAKSFVLVAFYLCFMILIAAVEITNRQVRTYNGHFCDSLSACLAGGGLFGLYGALVVLRGAVWWDPRVVIPTAGIIIGNSVPGPSVAVDRLLSEVSEKQHEIEVKLSFGASGYEAVLPALQSAVLAAMMPKLNLMSVIGIVTIPGMMTGQLMGGASPFVAAKYQMIIIFLGVTATAIATYTAVLLAVYHAIIDAEHDRLTHQKIIKKSGGKLSLDAAILQACADFFNWVRFDSICRKCCCFLSLCPDCRRAAVEAQGTSIKTNSIRNYRSGLKSGPLASNRGSVQYSRLLSDSVESPTSPPPPLRNHHQQQEQKQKQQQQQFGVSSSGEIELKQAPNTTSVDEFEENCNKGLSVAWHIVNNNGGREVIRRQSDSSTTNPMFNKDSATAVKQPRLQPEPIVLTVSGLNVCVGEEVLFPIGSELDFFLRRGEVVSLEGTSGIGKTRLLRAISQLDQPLSGTLTLYGIGGEETMVCEDSDRGSGSWGIGRGSDRGGEHGEQHIKADWRRNVIYVPQALPPLPGTPFSLLVESLNFRSRTKATKQESTVPSRACAVASVGLSFFFPQTTDADVITSPDILGSRDLATVCSDVERLLLLPVDKLQEPWSKLSGGERQRAVIACGIILAGAFATQPNVTDSLAGVDTASPEIMTHDDHGGGSTKGAMVLLLDEPTAACDPTTCAAVEAAILNCGIATLLITHDERQADRLAHRRILLTKTGVAETAVEAV